MFVTRQTTTAAISIGLPLASLTFEVLVVKLRTRSETYEAAERTYPAIAVEGFHRGAIRSTFPKGKAYLIETPRSAISNHEVPEWLSSWTCIPDHGNRIVRRPDGERGGRR